MGLPDPSATGPCAPASPLGTPQTLRERIARATWDFAYAEDLLPPPWPEEGEEREIAMGAADAVLEALGLEQVGWQEPGVAFDLHRYEEGDCEECGCVPLYRLAAAPTGDAGASSVPTTEVGQ